MSPIPIKKYQLGQIQQTVNKNTKTSTDGIVMSNLQQALSDTEKSVAVKTLGESIPFIFWQDKLNDYGYFGTKKDTYNGSAATHRYDRGTKVNVDFGYGMDKEMMTAHPAIVVYDLPYDVVVIPTTSDDGIPVSTEIKKSVIHCPSDKAGIFPKDTLLYLHQVRMVSKNRIIKNLGCNVKDYVVPQNIIDELNKYLPHPVIPQNADLLKCIEWKLAYLYAPESVHEVKRLNEQIKVMQEQLAMFEVQEALMQVAPKVQEVSK
ncbi:type II toxin-antitoxin system PemK/MazF family toxin [Brevibacillus nitrificans]|uniref:type II toxin-antitoxin system PemK/MazF family toxin n=1 Tax=Brevibacillus nitrificans TaxID=651560 RepID=UPI0028595FDC|nr:type II toxin-antitoxin system PemK/MazF family toxin [Brevibacillus nitrificans]MDR7315328.1 hypothetical protein [Brevibacillus nitrificans]